MTGKLSVMSSFSYIRLDNSSEIAMPQTTRLKTRVVICVLVLGISALLFAQGETTHAVLPHQTNASAHIKWEGTPKIARYRLQLSSNEQFSDIIFDKLVQGREYTVTELAPGRYFWRVAPAAGETGAYSKPLPVTVEIRGSNFSTNISQPTYMMPPADVGWRTGTGMIEQPLAAKLRAGGNMDVVGVNNYGMVYAIGGDNGIALWSARYRPNAKKGEPVNSDGAVTFTPLLIDGKDGLMNVLAAYDSGVRALEGATGREMWRAALAGEVMSGVTLNPEKDGVATLGVFDDSGTLSFLKADSGQIISQTKIEGRLVERPVAVRLKNESAVLLGLNNGTLDVRNAAGVSLFAVRLDAALTTAPLVVRGQGKQLVMIGTESGLVALDASDLTPLWRVATEGDAPRGLLAAADVDADGTEDLVMITRRGRVVAVNLANGKIKWYAEGATDASRAAFADVNGDGALDVLVAGGTAFALGFSGKNGALIWKADETASKSPGSNDAPRALLSAAFIKGSPPLLVGVDTARTGLRAVGLPDKSVR